MSSGSLQNVAHAAHPSFSKEIALIKIEEIIYISSYFHYHVSLKFLLETVRQVN